ncbi:RNA polymerase sigma-70 factor [Tellurirhabdus rosea]|uniref:RNA polymerase sigma-70 factor n=1 Tax=Tellurirhabdus rosea TaxID=2674997 RepID=UPI002256D6BF|nr:RNA polymerase sigma-70 factor [Tellurirhabdus rosea]
MQISEQDVLTAIRQGDEKTFEQVFRQFYNALCQYAYTYVKDWDDAEETVQAVFLTVWEKRETLDIQVSLKSYLYRAVHNRCLNRIRHAAVQAEYQQQASVELQMQSAEAPSQTLIADELSVHLQNAIQKLPTQCRIIFEMSRFEELKYGEIAERLGLSIKTVENQIGKALRILRTELADYLPLLLIEFSFLGLM